LAWKSGARLLGAYGLSATSPRTAIREMAAQGWIDDAELWLHFLELRNQTVHNYNLAVAERVFSGTQRFLPVAKALHTRLCELASG
jgi:uncharacterized protein YutE (UPF0331/DUF86 family)